MMKQEMADGVTEENKEVIRHRQSVPCNPR